MNIGMILDNEFTGDMRVENEVVSLCQAGFNVFVLCFNHGSKANEEDFHGAKIIRLDISKFRKNKMKGFVNTFIDPYTPYWASKIKQFVQEFKIDALHVHDLYLLGAAFKANKKLNLPVIGDLHENFPAALKHYKFVNQFPGKYIISIKKWEETEVQWIQKADHIITVIEEAITRYQNLGLPKDKMSVVANYVNPDLFLSLDQNDEIAAKFKDKFVITYTGGFDLHRGLECVVKSLPMIKKEIPNIMLVLVGTGANEGDLKELATSLGVIDCVSFEGWQSPSVLPFYNKASDVCIIPHLKTEHTDNTIPHKLFQYMLLQKPVVSTNCDPIQRIVEESNSGVIYESNNAQDLADKIINLSKNPDLIQKMGLNGEKAVQEKYNWDQTAVNLINIYKGLNKNN